MEKNSETVNIVQWKLHFNDVIGLRYTFHKDKTFYYVAKKVSLSIEMVIQL